MRWSRPTVASTIFFTSDSRVRSPATATAAIYIAFVFLVSLAGKSLADGLRRRYGLAAS